LWVQFLLLDLSETWGIPKLDALIIIFPINMDSWLHIIPTDCWFIIHFPCHEWVVNARSNGLVSLGERSKEEGTAALCRRSCVIFSVG
jgi:hypothetical protein